MAVPAVPELVDGGSLAAADALFEHALETAPGRLRLRLVGVVPPGRGRILSLVGERPLDGGALLGSRLRDDLEIHGDGD
jgi:hypothetical protein